MEMTRGNGPFVKSLGKLKDSWDMGGTIRLLFDENKDTWGQYLWAIYEVIGLGRERWTFVWRWRNPLICSGTYEDVDTD